MNIIGSYPKSRLRRLRKAQWIRNLVSENNISSSDLILPIFIREGRNKIESIKSMPGVKRYSVDRLTTVLNQVKNFTFVKDLNKDIFKLLSYNDKFIYKEIKSNKINLKKLYKILKSSNLNKIISKPQYQALFLTLEWYKKYYGKK